MKAPNICRSHFSPNRRFGVIFFIKRMIMFAQACLCFEVLSSPTFDVQSLSIIFNCLNNTQRVFLHMYLPTALLPTFVLMADLTLLLGVKSKPREHKYLNYLVIHSMNKSINKSLAFIFPYRKAFVYIYYFY